MSIRLVMVALALSGSTAAVAGMTATAELRDAEGAARGTAKVLKARDGVEVTARITGLAPGTYAIHVHAVGRCEGPDFASAGAHWNPLGTQHGIKHPEGPHMGDLPNVTIKANGKGRIVGHLKGAAMQGGTNGLMDGDGAAIVLHAKADDHVTQPTGGSGPRIACGVLTAK